MTTVLAAHGLGLGPWVFEPWRAAFEAAGFVFSPLTLPGHGDGQDASFAEVVAAIERAADNVSGPVILCGHSFSGLAVQTILCRRTVAAAVLVCPLPPGRPAVGSATLAHLPRALATLALGRPYTPSRRGWTDLGFSHVPPAHLADAMARSVPWPNRLCRDLIRAPEVLPTSLDTPVLVVIGGADPVIPPAAARVVADLFEAVCWRYDDLAHTPMLEPGSDRMLADIVAFCMEPVRPRVLESDGYGPEEGVGHAARKARRGPKARRRSAYGQKEAAR